MSRAFDQTSEADSKATNKMTMAGRDWWLSRTKNNMVMATNSAAPWGPVHSHSAPPLAATCKLNNRTPTPPTDDSNLIPILQMSKEQWQKPSQENINFRGTTLRLLMLSDLLLPMLEHSCCLHVGLPHADFDFQRTLAHSGKTFVSATFAPAGSSIFARETMNYSPRLPSRMQCRVRRTEKGNGQRHPLAPRKYVMADASWLANTDRHVLLQPILESADYLQRLPFFLGTTILPTDSYSTYLPL
ncbi:hypothetical protein JOL62DRAFT_361292 [Phyllosticta paracitricarpa]|uniref:Uncharacterized protein n=1 Tax=Phyllosticta paracitricarpa TaxID=2016321 RepID=A0ABR1MTM9_9PEZI